jgi:hypothetical protein
MSKAKTKREIANGVFNKALPTREKVGDRKFRQNVLVAIEKRTGATRPQAATLYNFAKKTAVAAGLTPDFSRSANTANVPQPAEGDNWKAVDKESGEILGYGPSRAKTRAAFEGATVSKI